MKKLVSLLLVLVLCVSLFAVTTVAFAASDSAAKEDLVGAWAEKNGSRIKFTEKEFSGTIKYEEAPKVSEGDGEEGEGEGESEPAKPTIASVSVSGKYTYDRATGKITIKSDDDDEKKPTLEITYNSTSKKLTFIDYTEVKSDEGEKGEDEPAGAAEEEPTLEKLYEVELTRRTIAYDKDPVVKFETLDEVTSVEKVQGATDSFKFNYAWLLDETKVEKIFGGISYVLTYGKWTAEITADGKLDISWDNTITVDKDEETKIGSVTIATLERDSTDDGDSIVGTWTGELNGKSIEMVFNSSKVTVKRAGMSLGSAVEYTTEEGKTTFTTGKEDKPYAVASESDKIYLQYATPSIDYKDFDSWNSVEIGSPVNVIGTTSSTSRIGWWVFRFVVRDSNNTVLTDTIGEEVRSSRIDIWFGDSSAPTYRDNGGLTSDMISARDNGLTVDSDYTIKTNLRYIDNGSVTVNYRVEKLVKGEWTTILVKGQDVVEGYEDYIKASGVIKPKQQDVMVGSDNKPIYVYRIIYSLIDDQGYESDTTILELYVKEPSGTSISGATAWQIVLYVIAGLSAVGIIVVLCVKPKQPQTEDARKAHLNKDASSKTDAVEEPAVEAEPEVEVELPEVEPIPAVEEPAVEAETEPVVEAEPAEEATTEEPTDKQDE